MNKHTHLREARERAMAMEPLQALDYLLHVLEEPEPLENLYFDLPTYERRLLQLLQDAGGYLVSRYEVEEVLGGFVGYNTVYNTVFRLRHRLRGTGLRIRTVHGRGWRLEEA